MTDATNGAEVAIKSHNAIRGNAISEIAKRAAEETADDMADFNEDSGEVVAKVKEVEAATDPIDDKQAAPIVEAAPEVLEESETIVVDGKSQQVSRDKILEAGRRTLQKESAADKRLQEATEILRRAEQHVQRVSNVPSSDAQNMSLPGEGVTTESSQHQQFDAQDINSAIDRKVTDTLYMRDASKARKVFDSEFPEVANNPIVMTWVAQQEDIRIHNAMATGSGLGDPLEAYRAHGQAARDQLKAFLPPAAAPFVDKADRKRDVVSISGANVRTAAPQPEKPKTVAQTIEGMRKSRNQRIN